MFAEDAEDFCAMGGSGLSLLHPPSLSLPLSLSLSLSPLSRPAMFIEKNTNY
jgi:hypothetical protein